MHDSHGKSAWLESHHPIYHPLKADLECEVAIVGAGIVGAAAAYKLAKAGLRVAVFDKENASAMGSTGYSAGFLPHSHSFDLQELLGMRKEEHSVQIYRSGIEALEEIKTVIEKEKIDCQFKKTGALYIAAERSHSKKIEREYEALTRFEIPAEFYRPEGKRLKIGNRFGAVKTYGDYAVNPVKLVQGLLRVVLKHDGQVFTGTAVVSIVEMSDGGCLLTTDKGHKINAKKVIVAASGWPAATQLLPRKFLEKVVPIVSHVMITKPISGISKVWNGELLWDTYRIYHYLRLLDDERVMVGGEDSLFGVSPHGAVTRRVQKNKHLLRVLKNLFPDFKIEIDYGWSGVIYVPLDELPLIETRGPISYLVTEGIPPGWTVAKIAADRVIFGSSKYDGLYDAQRSFGLINNIFLRVPLPLTLKHRLLQIGIALTKFKDMLDKMIKY